MRKFLKACGARLPETLRGTRLRQHLATLSVELQLSEHELNMLANFMGHDETIHRDYYRLTLAQRDIIHVAALLKKAQGIYEGNNVNRTIEKTDSKIEENVTNSSATKDISTSNHIESLCIDNKLAKYQGDSPNLQKNKRSRTKKRSEFLKTPPEIGHVKKHWDEQARDAILETFSNILNESVPVPKGQEL